MIWMVGGIACGLAIAMTLYLIANLIGWRQTHTNVVAVDTNVYQCLECHNDIQGTPLHYCPHCGREIEKVIDK